jgi:neopullulanase
LLQWRKQCDAVKYGSLRQFTVADGVYVYSREYKGHTVTIMLNGTDAPACVSLARYAEALPASTARDVVSGRTLRLDQGTLQLDVRGVVVLDFAK